MSDEIELQPGSPDSSPGLAGAAALMMGLTLLSALTGLVRVMVFGRQFGATGEIGAYFQAFRIPDFIYFLLAGGALRTGFVPVFTEYMAKGRVVSAWRTFSTTLWTIIGVGTAVVTLGIIFAPQLIWLVAAGFIQKAPQLATLTVQLMRVMFPAQIFMLIGGLLMGALNARKHFLWPGLGPVAYNLVIILAALLSPLLWGLPTVAYAVPLAALIGNVLLQIAPLRRYGARLQAVLDFHDEGFRQVLRLALPVVFGLAIAEINLIITSNLATVVDPLLGVGPLEYANRLWKLPTRVIGAGIAIALFPTLAEHYALGAREAFRRDFSFGMRNALFLTIPGALAMVILRAPLIRLLFGFEGAELTATANMLLWYSFGIVALSAVYVLARSFYARHDTITPVWVGASSVVICVAVALALMQAMGLAGLALATSAANIANAVLLGCFLKRRVGNLDGTRILSSLLRQGLPLTAFGLSGWAVMRWCIAWGGTEGLLAQLVAVVAPLLVGGALFLALAWLLRVEELHTAWRLLTRRRGRN